MYAVENAFGPEDGEPSLEFPMDRAIHLWKHLQRDAQFPCVVEGVVRRVGRGFDLCVDVATNLRRIGFVRVWGVQPGDRVQVRLLSEYKDELIYQPDH